VQLIRRNSGRVLAVAVVPHAVCSSSKRLNPALYKGSNKFDT
jgi:hypothetical protein